MRLIDADALYEKTAEWEAQALHMVEVTMNDEDKTKWRKWSVILAERSAFKHDIADAPIIEPEQRWIPCKEKMPKELTRVLVCTDRGSVCIAYLKVRHKEEDSRWLVYGADPDGRGKVIKWMPLPET